MNKLWAIVILLMVSVTSTANADSSSHKMAVLKLLDVTNSRQVADQMMVQINAIIDKQFDSLDLDSDGMIAAQKAKKEMAAWLSDLLAWDNMKEIYVDVYMDVFSEQEINDMIAFYQTPLGKKILTKMPMLIQTTFEKTQAMIQKKMPEIQKRLESYASDLDKKYNKEKISDKPQQPIL